MHSCFHYNTTMRSHKHLYQFLALGCFLSTASPAFARAGGGSNGGAGGIINLIVLPIVLIYGAYVTYRLNKKSKECHVLLDQVRQREKGWDTATLEGIVERVFLGVQQAWCEQDLKCLEFLTKGPARLELKGKIAELTRKGHKNRMDELEITGITLLNVQNYLDDELDNFTVKIDAKARDYDVDTNGAIVSANTSKKKKYSNPSEVPAEAFHEFWTFEREGDDWVLLELAQASAWKSAVERPMFDEGTAPYSPSAAQPRNDGRAPLGVPGTAH